MTRLYDVHVCPDLPCHRWRVMQRGRTLSSHRTQSNAVRAAKRAARRHRVDLVTHARDGRIRSKDSYGNEGPADDTEH